MAKIYRQDCKNCKKKFKTYYGKFCSNSCYWASLRGKFAIDKIKDISGKRFGRLVVLERTKNKRGSVYCWLCKCDCGKKLEISGRDLRVGKRNFRHGGAKTRLYRIFNGMKQRCFNKNNHKYGVYGGRGILVCKEWLDFKNFRDWALKNGYGENLSIDRIDNDGNYKSDNCRWIPLEKQAKNKTSNILFSFKGKTKDLADWAREFNISPSLLSYYRRIGKPLEDVFNKYSKNIL